VVFHEHYFDSLGGNGQAGASERKAIADAFGSFDTWETEFRRIGAGLGGGSGWSRPHRHRRHRSGRRGNTPSNRINQRS